MGHTVILLLRIIDIAMLIAPLGFQLFLATPVRHRSGLSNSNRLGILATIIFFEIGQVYVPCG